MLSDHEPAPGKKWPQFLALLYYLLEKDKGQDIIKWSRDGTTVCITDVGKMSNTILPKFFKHKNYTTFVRQLNLYGFRKGVNEDGADIFIQPLFSAQHPELIGSIKRNQKQKRKVKTQEMITDQSSGSNSFASEFTLQDRLLQEIRIIQSQQQLMDINLTLLNERHLRDETKMIETMRQKCDEELATYMYYCLIFVLQNYLSRSLHEGIGALGPDCAADINYKIAMYRENLGRFYGRSSCECEFLILLKISCEKTPQDTKEYIRSKCKDFFVWLNVFLTKNNLRFPCAERLFYTLIICSLSGTPVKTEFLTSDDIVKKLLSKLLTHWKRSAEEIKTEVRVHLKGEQICRIMSGRETEMETERKEPHDYYKGCCTLTEEGPQKVCCECVCCSDS